MEMMNNKHIFIDTNVLVYATAKSALNFFLSLRGDEVAVAISRNSAGDSHVALLRNAPRNDSFSFHNQLIIKFIILL